MKDSSKKAVDRAASDLEKLSTALKKMENGGGIKAIRKAKNRIDKNSFKSRKNKP